MEKKPDIVEDPAVSYGTIGNQDLLRLIERVRKGISYRLFQKVVKNSPFAISDWIKFLNVSERTVQRYKKGNKTFDAVHSEKIVEITLLFRKGVAVFGSREKFGTWLGADLVALGGQKPRDLLDSSFGISLLKDELIRIEHGVPA